ncbi:MAG: bifunctional diaminohydroxyphosphoribosylaminopyrimidine deaminase/5-amino-6-(5-phosphoribosylamino)uracil reductase RibD [Deltaproteobacteria bacterium]|nr:bifunctional diaminohydroxyphosphoribosylaminopyrimidine deaminase/5-amino-6-(5-phosphoribosylamino)uracil reductase RibD [Deltaproteobacteria bacterium]
MIPADPTRRASAELREAGHADPATGAEAGALEPAREARYRALLGELAREAQQFRYRVAPNPCVGAALLDHDQEVARGFHTAWGGRHAEIEALRVLETSRGAAGRFDTLVVTLEPCSSHGKTPPCVDAVLATGVERIVIGGLDPDPRHQGRGVRILRGAGREVVVLDGSASLAEGSAHFLAWISHRRMSRGAPWTIAKWAQTRSGQLSPPLDVGEGRWISSPAARAEVQRWRGEVDAIVTGVGTVLADDPRLSVRGPELPTYPPARVVLDSTLRTPATARLLAPPAPDERAGPVFVLTGRGADPSKRRELEDRGAHVEEIGTAPDGKLSLEAAQRWLWRHCVRRILLEAGPALLERWIAEERVDQWLVYEGAIEEGRGPSLRRTLESARLRTVRRRELGVDTVLEAFSG